MSQHVNAPVSCSNCGEKWSRDPAYEVVCPICHADIGKPCMRPSEHTAWSIHPQRDQAAMNAGILKKCSASKSSIQQGQKPEPKSAATVPSSGRGIRRVRGAGVVVHSPASSPDTMPTPDLFAEPV